jgi:hypothetical protein
MTRLFTTGLTLLALVSLIAANTTPAHAARDKHARGQVTVADDGLVTVMLETNLALQGKSFVYAEFYAVSLQEMLAFLDANGRQLAEEPAPDTVFGLGVGFIVTKDGEVRTAIAVVRIEGDGHVQVDYDWTSPIILADGTVVHNTAPFPRYYPPANSIGFKSTSSGIIDGTDTTNLRKLIIQIPLQ